MIYLTFDCNIWILALDQSWTVDTELEYLDYWIDSDQITLLLPDVIKYEWQKNRTKQRNSRREKLREFFAMAEEILPSSFFRDYLSEDAQDRIIDAQITRIDMLISKAHFIPISESIRDKVLSNGIEKKAPMHKKSSVADALIIYSVMDFAEKHPNGKYYFISKDEGFYDGKEVHPDLKDDFKRLNIKAYKRIKDLVPALERNYSLSIKKEVLDRRRDRIKNAIKERIYNPEYEALFTSTENQFIDNLNTIDFILKAQKPTKEQAIYVLSLIDSDSAFEGKFYDRLKNASWFLILHTKGVFTPNEFEKWYWPPITYLEFIANEIHAGRELHLIDDILKIIRHLSKLKTTNGFIWTLIIKILSRLPNDRISTEILNFIPKWFIAETDTMMQTHEICFQLIPKFLSDNPSSDDIKKAEVILGHLFAVNIPESPLLESDTRSAVYSPTYLHFVQEALVRQGLAEKIARFCSTDFLLQLANNLRDLFMYFGSGFTVNISSSNKSFEINIQIGDKTIQIAAREASSTSQFQKRDIENYDLYNETETRTIILSLLADMGIPYHETKENALSLAIILNAIFNGSNNYFSIGSLLEKDRDTYHVESIQELLVLTLRNVLPLMADHRLQELDTILKKFTGDRFYRNPFFRRLAIYTISLRWDQLKDIFWALINLQGTELFSNHEYNSEIYALLKTNGKAFSPEERDILAKIINDGPSDLKDYDEGYLEFWQFRWYAALKYIPLFQDEYNRLAESQKMSSDDIENLGKSRLRTASVSPITLAELLNMNGREIVEYIQNFAPADKWTTSNVSGLANMVESAIITEPGKFTPDLNLYLNIPYIYVYQMINGYREAFGKKKNIDWAALLAFCKSYISNPRFYSGELKIDNSGLRITPQDVAGAIGQLLTSGLQFDETAIDATLFPLAQDILEILTRELQPVDDIKQKKSDFVTYSFNSNSGKVLRALLDYSLIKSRLTAGGNVWENKIQDLFDLALKRGIIDAYILLGYYFQHFYFLDQNWTLLRVTDLSFSNEENWEAFMGGFVMGNPPSSTELLRLLRPYYLKAISINKTVVGTFSEGLMRHIAAFYIWGFEDLSQESLITAYFEANDPEAIDKLVTFISRQDDYLSEISRDERERLEVEIIKLWKYLSIKLKDNPDPEVQKVLSKLPQLLPFARELSDELAKLITISLTASPEQSNYYYLLEDLNTLKGKGPRSIAAINIARILKVMPIKYYIAQHEGSYIIDLVRFLYENGLKSEANDICNNYSR
ncbi:MAG: DUF4935 domain-containing protein, partial [Bacteroidetes bacterium]|nr:DUF4935 domain-containing protein [Bacteroidota bacterium]